MMEPRYRRASATAHERAARIQASAAPPASQRTAEEAPGRITPRSVLRYRPIAHSYVVPLSDGTQVRVTEHELATLPQNYQNAAQLVTAQVAPPTSRRSFPSTFPMPDAPLDEEGPGRTHPRGTDALPRPRRQRVRVHWLVWVGLVLFSMVIGSLLVNILAAWWQVTRDDWQYGRPRTFQVEANVGHGTAAHPNSHFIALNLNRHIEVIEIAGDDLRTSHIYVGPTVIGQGQELTPVTLSFEDVNHDGKPDMVMHIGDALYVFLNTGSAFQPAPNQ